MLLEFADISSGFDADKPLVEHVNMELHEGEIACVLGPNGCGKTTLVRSALGMRKLLGGKAFLDGRDLAKIPAQQRARQFAYVAQAHNQPFPYRVAEMVMLGRMAIIAGSGKPRAADYDAVEEILGQLDLYDLRNEPYTDLSGGQVQRVMIARALAQDPKVLVLDEPTAALDYGNAAKVLQAIRSLADNGQAAIMITHAPNQAFLLRSKVLLLRPGQVPVFGEASQAITSANIAASYGHDVRVVEFLDRQKRMSRLCAPVADPAKR